MTEKRPKIVIVEDDRLMLKALKGMFKDLGYASKAYTCGQALIAALPTLDCDAVILDLVLPDIHGSELLPMINEKAEVPVIVLTGNASHECALRTSQLGAYQYLSKPVEPSILADSVSRAIKNSILRKANEGLNPTVPNGFDVTGIIGCSPAIVNVKEAIRHIAPTNLSVLIHGETGTGKELVARALHQNSPRANSPFVPVNCAALNEQLAESLLFGHKKGAFTGATEGHQGLLEQANRGTLFLDEVSSLPPSVQGKLLRVIEDRSVQPLASPKTRKLDVRFLAASNTPLEKLIEKNQFRSDLYYRLCGVTIEVPPLRRRTSDIPMLALHFMKKFAHTIKKKLTGFSQKSIDQMNNYKWPGNVRQLRSIIEQSVIFASKTHINELPIRTHSDKKPILPNTAANATQNPSKLNFTIEKTSYRQQENKLLASMKRQYLRMMLAETKGNLTEAAKLSEISYRTLLRWMKELKIEQS